MNTGEIDLQTYLQRRILENIRTKELSENKRQMQQNTTLKLYIAYFVIEYTNIWHGPDGEKIIKEKQSYYIEIQMFPAETAEQAYKKAADWITGFSDSTHDGDGDLNTEKCIGINQLEYICDYDDFNKKVNEMYGLECGFIRINDFMHNKKPVIRNKPELEIFMDSSGLTINNY